MGNYEFCLSLAIDQEGSFVKQWGTIFVIIRYKGW